MPIETYRIESFTCVVLDSWTATYPDPICVSAEEPLELSGRQDIWDGYVWLWAKGRDGKEGWIPDSIVSNGEYPKATESYSAMELTCQKGQELTAKKWCHGWVWCSNKSGKHGWVPERILKSIDKSLP